jgi:hypothetical protein
MAELEKLLILKPGLEKWSAEILFTSRANIVDVFLHGS